MGAFFKNLAALAIGGAVTGIGAAQIDPSHLGGSTKSLGLMALLGALNAVIHLNVKAPNQ